MSRTFQPPGGLLLQWARRALVALGVLLWAGQMPARADDISAAGRGVVRIVTIATADGEVVGFGHGSGFAVAPNRIVTNAHVVELAARYPDNVVIGVVPSEGDKSYQGKLIAYDAQRDLALIEFKGTRLPPVTLYSGPVDDGESVIALGYPGNVDLATAQSAADFIKPLMPVRSQGGFAGRRSLTGVQVLLHTASIARGNSGGPLLDQCGRVIGVNSAITKAEEGDSTFGFAVADAELIAFLAEAKQPVADVGLPCTSIEERLRLDKDAAAQAADAQVAAAQIASAQAALAREAALEKARAAQERHIENVIALAAFLLVGGALAIGGAGMLEIRNNRRGAIWTLAGGGVLIIASAAVFFTRPDGTVHLPDANPATDPLASTDQSFGKMMCHILPERSRINVSKPVDVMIDYGRDGCINGQTQYAENGKKWERILVPANEQTVSVIEFDGSAKTYTESRYFLTASQMTKARQLRDAVEQKACTPDEAERQKLRSQQSAIRDALPPQPDEWLVFGCTKVP
ncbi:MAG: trypsin-like peptidase domain-containing protein [Sphingomonas sp.]|nr:trypsin-like peptidase domain-containing protein [Sphingomonas sp.]